MYQIVPRPQALRVLGSSLQFNWGKGGGSSLPRACVTQVYKVKELLESYGCTVQTSNTETMHARLPNAMRLYEEVLTMHAGETPEKEKLEACIDELRQKDENPEARRGSHATRDLNGAHCQQCAECRRIVRRAWCVRLTQAAR